MKPRTLRKPPIVEAMLDWRVKASPGLNVGLLKNVEMLREDFPRVEDLRQVQTTLSISPRSHEARRDDRGVIGCRYTSADSRTIIQFRNDGMTVNRLSPYNGWAALMRLAEPVWMEYRKLAKPLQLSRIAVRTINRLPFLPGVKQLERHLRTLPVLPDGMPQSVFGMASHVTLRDDATDAMCNIIQVLEPDHDTQSGQFILDIDAFIERVDGISETEMKVGFESLHRLKNRVFFESLTPEYMRGFE
jgi:uncharacterized protein (TIGR04255 family)